MKKLVLAVAAVLLTAMMFGCGNDNGVTPNPPNTGPWGITFYPKYTDGSSTEGIKLQVFDGCPIGGNCIATLPVLQDSVTVLDLERNIEYCFFFMDQDNEVIMLKLGDHEENFFSLSLLDGEEASSLEVPSFSLVAKVIPTILIFNIIPITSEAEVWVDGDSLGSADASGYFETTIEPGDHKITLIGWGCREKRGSIAISQGETKTQNIQLEVWDLTGTWKRESDDLEVDVTLINVNELWGLTPVGRFFVKGNSLTFVSSISDAHAEGVILENGTRIEFTLHTQYGSDSHVYEKIF